MASCSIYSSNYIDSSMVNKLKKKKTPSTTALVNKILQVEADAQGLSLAEFKKKRDELISVVEESMDIEDEGVKELKNIKESLDSISEDASTKLKQIKKDLDR